MQQQFNSMYSNKDAELKLENVQTQSKVAKPIKKKNLKRKEGLKMTLNVKTNTSSVKRKKRKQSKSKRRNSISKKRATNSDAEKHVFIQHPSHGHKASLSPNKDFETVGNRTRVLSSQNFSKSSIKLKNLSKNKPKSKKSIKLNKDKSHAKLSIKKDKIKSSTHRAKLKKSPGNEVFESTNFQSLEVPNAEDIRNRQSVGYSPKNFSSLTNSKGQSKKETILPEKNINFLEFVEEHERKHLKNKEQRLKNFNNSIASENTGVTTNANNLSKKADMMKLDRPFSGGVLKNDKKQNKSLFKKQRLPISRPKTAKNAMLEFEKSQEQKMSIGNPSSNEDKVADNESNHLPEIRENSSKNSSTNFELSPSKDEFGQSLKLGNIKQSPMVSIQQTSRDKYHEDSQKGDERNHKASYSKNINKSSSANNLLRSSRRNPCEMANEPSMHVYKDSKDLVIMKESVGDCTSDVHTQLNLGSPITKQKQIAKPEIIVSNKPKRPSSAGNRLTLEHDEPL